MTAAAPKTCLCALILLFWAISGATAQEWVGLSSMEGEEYVAFDGYWRNTEDAGDSRELEFEQGLRLRQRGYILDPRIANFMMEVEPVFSQTIYDDPDNSDTFTDEFLNYSGRFSALHGTPSPISVFGDGGRASGDTDGLLGARNEFDISNWQVGLNWKTPAFPTTLTYSERFRDQTFRSGLSGSTSDLDDTLRTLRLSGRSSKSSLLVEQIWFEDHVPPDNDYDSTRVRASHGFQWGKGSRLDSRVEWFDRNESNAVERLTVDERARLQHTETLYSTGSYSFLDLDQESDATTHNGRYALTHRLYRNLTTTFDLEGFFGDSDVGQETQYKAGLNLGYNKRVFWNGRLSTDIGGSYRVTDVDSEGGFLSVTNESHLVTVTTISFLLDRRFVDTATVVITDTTETITYTPGSDYTLAAAGNDQTEVFIIPGGAIGSSAPITVLVDYNYEVLPSIKFSTTIFSARGGLDFGWVSLSHVESLTDTDRISGSSGDVLTDRRDSTSRLEFRWERTNSTAILGTERRFLRSGDLETTTYTLDQSLFRAVFRQASLSLNASQVFTDAKGQNTDLYLGEVSLSWRPWPSLSLRPHAGAWYREDRGSSVSTSGTRKESFITAGLDLRWVWRKVELDLFYNHYHRGGNVTESDEDRVQLTMRRRF